MLALLSPAKSLDATPRPDVAGTTTPDFLDEASTLVDRLRKLSPRQLATLMDISDKLADQNHARFRAWSRETSPENAIPAILMFRGDVYQGFDAASLDAKDLTFAQKQLRILSGLYGLLRPLDLVHPYRLEMGTEFTTGRPKTLYEFWGDKLTDALNAAVAGQRKPTVINLASSEYFGAINPDALCARLIIPAFKEEKEGKLRSLNLFMKRARGLMARFIVTNRLKNADDILDFNLEGYSLNEAESSDDRPVFSRPQP